MDIIDNLKLLNISNDKRYDKNINNYLLNFEYEKIDYIKNLLKVLGYTIENKIIKKNFDIDFDKTFKEEIKKVFNNKKFKTLFNTKKYVKEKNHISLINEILNKYGLEIIKEIHRKRDDNNKIVKDINIIQLKYIDIIKEYFEREKILKDKKNICLFINDDEEDDNIDNCLCGINLNRICRCDFESNDLLNIYCIICNLLKCRCD